MQAYIAKKSLHAYLAAYDVVVDDDDEHQRIQSLQS